MGLCLLLAKFGAGEGGGEKKRKKKKIILRMVEGHICPGDKNTEKRSQGVKIKILR